MNETIVNHHLNPIMHGNQFETRCTFLRELRRDTLLFHPWSSYRGGARITAVTYRLVSLRENSEYLSSCFVHHYTQLRRTIRKHS